MKVKADPSGMVRKVGQGGGDVEQKREELDGLRRSSRTRRESKLVNGDYIRTDAFKLGKSGFVAVMKAVPKREAIHCCNASSSSAFFL